MRSMCSLKKYVTFITVACISIIVCASTFLFAAEAHADEPLKLDSPYGYKITVSAGQGSLDGVPESIQVAAGSQVNLSQYLDEANVVLPDSKYYIKGIRLAGHDYGEDAVDDLVFNATEDAQYVIAYGLKKNQVSYTVNYVDANGNQIAESQTFWGNPGDKPVVAYRYIDNYLPTSWNITGTLEEGKDNTFNFVYNAAPGVTYTTVTVPGEATTAETAAPTGTTPGVAAPAGPTAVAEAAAAGEVIDEEGNPLAAPDQMTDITDDKTPLASGSTASESQQVIPWLIAGGILLVGVIILVIALMRKKRSAQA